jgi:iron complex outermembrane receptor protein
VAANGGLGTWTLRDGTGWDTFEVQAAYTPQAGDWGGGRHSLTAGLHRNAYRLDSPTYNASDWRQESSVTALDQYYQGRTEVQALYAQDAWRIDEALTLTAGVRSERFRAYDGEQLGNGSTVVYAERKLSGTSPKASLAWRLQEDLTLKLSAGRGVRFPERGGAVQRHRRPPAASP